MYWSSSFLSSVDMGSLLPKTGGVEADLGGMEPPAAVCVGGQSLVFTNSHHNCARTATHSYASAASGTNYTHGALVRQPATHTLPFHGYTYLYRLSHRHTINSLALSVSPQSMALVLGL